MKPSDLEAPAATLKVLSHPVRLLILHHLGQKATASQSVTELYTALDIPQAVMSQHLITLKDRGVLKNEKIGTKIYYRLAQPWVTQVLNLVLAQANA